MTWPDDVPSPLATEARGLDLREVGKTMRKAPLYMHAGLFMRYSTVVAVACSIAACSTLPPQTTEPQAPQAGAEEKALADRARAAVARAQGTPGQEHANNFAAPDVQRMIETLAGERKASSGSEIRAARNRVSGLLKEMEQGPAWPRPPECSVPRAAGKIVLDGKLDETAWSEAARFEGLYRFNKPEKTNDPATVWRVLWDADYLYFAFECSDRDLVAREIGRDGDVWLDDCVEVFLLPEFRTGSYWEIVVGPSGSIFDGLHSKYWKKWGFVSHVEEDVEGLQVGVTLEGTLNKPGDIDTGYTVEIAVPFDQLPGYSRATPAPGQTLHFMMARLDRTGEAHKPYAYQPLLAWGHNIWNHAVMVLAPAKDR